MAVGEAGEDAPNDSRLGGVDGPLSADRLAGRVQLAHDGITEGAAARRLSRLHAAAQATAGLVGEVLQEQRVHRALKPDMQLADLAFGQRDNANAGEAQALKQRRHVFLVARQPVQRLRHHDVKGRLARTSSKAW